MWHESNEVSIVNLWSADKSWDWDLLQKNLDCEQLCALFHTLSSNSESFSFQCGFVKQLKQPWLGLCFMKGSVNFLSDPTFNRICWKKLSAEKMSNQNQIENSFVKSFQRNVVCVKALWLFLVKCQTKMQILPKQMVPTAET